MAEEFFNQVLKNTVAETDRFGVGVPSIEGCDNVLFPKLRSSMFKGETGKSLSTGVTNITFPVAFPSSNYIVIPEPSEIPVIISNKSAAGFDIEPLEATTISYIAILL